MYILSYVSISALSMTFPINNAGRDLGGLWLIIAEVTESRFTMVEEGIFAYS